MIRHCLSLLLCLAFLFVCNSEIAAQTTEKNPVFNALRYRSVGPFRGGRSAAVTGVPGKPTTFYFGATGGGVWKTDDAGSNWRNVTDGYFGGSIGAVTVAPSNPNIIYVGGGEVTIRGNVSHGSGMWKSENGGKTWESIGLTDSHHIPRIRVHPKDPNLVYVAALGHLYGPNQQRGVFRSTDGGKTWKKILFVNDEVGAVDLQIDPGNSKVLYASMWRIKRTPYSLESGGEGSGLFKSTDGGDTWKEITRSRGLPKGTVGIIGVDVSPVDSNRVFAIIEAADGGVFRSDNAGESWTKINSERKLRQRAWYYTRIYAGPKNKDEVYVLNVRFWRSIDGGKTYSSIRTPHGDHHDLWIDPDNADRLAIADDGGGQVSFNRGKTWSTYMNQPTAQFYRVTTDNHFPYRIYGAQQDNSTVRIDHRSRGSERDWEPTAGGESGHIAPDPTNPDIVYGGTYGGYLTRINHKTGERRNIHIWPDNPMGHGAGDGKFRFQWNFPIFFGQDKKTLFAAGNVLFKTTDGGGSWTQISPDLTRNDKTKLGSSGGPITKDNTSVEYYCTIFAAAQSHHDPNVIWCGSDDGLIHVTTDGGKKWNDVTPPELPEWSQINSLEIHPTKKGSIYIAATRYKLDDFKPYIYKTNDFGKTWQKITAGIHDKHFTRVVRADPDREGLLYAGTENGMYISMDDGKSWKSFQLNLPVVPITDLALKNQDLIVATQGRSFWIIDDLTPLHQFDSKAASQPAYFFKPRPLYRMGRRSNVTLRFHLKEKPDSLATLQIADSGGNVVKSFSSKPKKSAGETSLSLSSGMNTVSWNMRYASAKTFPGMILWGGGTQGPRAVPGKYSATLKIGKQEHKQEFEIKIDPRISATQEDLVQQFKFHTELRNALSNVNQTIGRIRDVRTQINALKKRISGRKKFAALAKQASEVSAKLTAIEEKLYQTKNQSPQDPLNFPIRLNNRLSALVSVVDTGDNAPTRQSREVYEMLKAEIDVQQKKFDALMAQDVPNFNKAVKNANVPAIFVDPPKGGE